MPTEADRIFRDFVRYTGDGLPNEPVGKPLPWGDERSGVHEPDKYGMRTWANGLEIWGASVAGLPPYPSFGAATATAPASHILVGGRLYQSDPSGPFASGDGRKWSPAAPNSYGRPILVLASGQSNMLGMSGTTGGERRTINGAVYCWEQIPGAGQTVGWKLAGPDSPDWPWGATGNSIAYHFCDMLQRQTGRPVYLVMHAAGGQPIAEWLPGGGGVPGATGSMYLALNAALVAARASTLPTGGTLASWGIEAAEILLWHQGEADADYTGTTGAQYIARTRNVFATLRNPASGGSSADPFIKPGAPIIMGELKHGGTSGPNATDSRNAEIAELNRVEELVVSASSRDLPAADNLHFNGSALQEFARRYFERLGAFPKLIPTEVSADHIRVAGRVVVLRGADVVVAAGANVTVNLPVTMKNSGFVPALTLTAHGASTPYPPLLGARTTTSFIIRNTGAQSMTVAWSITDAAL